MLIARALEQTVGSRFRIRLVLAAALALLLIASVPMAAGDPKQRLKASMFVSQTEAAPGDNVTFWIWIDPLHKEARRLVVTESTPPELAIVSTLAPDFCWQSARTWVCVQDDLDPFSIELRVLVGNGTEGKDLFNHAQIEVWNTDDDDDDEDDDDDDDDDDEDNTDDPITVSAKVRIVPAKPVEEPEPMIEVQMSGTEQAIVPGTPATYQVDVTNRGTAPAFQIAVVVSMPTGLILLSASRSPTWRDGHLTWVLDSVPAGGTERLLFNATLPVSSRADQVDLGLAATYGDASGGEVRVERVPSSVRVLPVPIPPPPSPLAIGLVAAVVAFVGRFLFLPLGPLGTVLTTGSPVDELFLLHRSGILLRHLSPNPRRNTDSDIMGGMLSAVRMFVEDSMAQSAGPLQEIRFNGGSILFISGANATLAAVNARGNRERFARRAMGLLQEFESRNGEALAHFDGVAGKLEGLDAFFGRFAS